MSKKILLLSLLFVALIALVLLFNSDSESVSFLSKHKKSYYPIDDACKKKCEEAKGINCGMVNINCCKPASCTSKSFWGKVYSQTCSSYVLVEGCTTAWWKKMILKLFI